jgi:hypothetical protein
MSLQALTTEDCRCSVAMQRSSKRHAFSYFHRMHATTESKFRCSRISSVLLIMTYNKLMNIHLVHCFAYFRSQIEHMGPAWSLRGRSDFGGAHYTGVKSANPGPASYGSVNPTVYKARSAGYTIQGRTHLKDYTTLKDNPGPNAYNPWNLGQQSAVKRGFTMGVRHSEYVMPLISNVDKF